MRTLITALTMVVALPLAAAEAQPAATRGVLVLAHGGQPAWNERVNALVASIAADQPAEVAFGMASRPSIQTAVDRLAAKGVTEIVAVPLFVSSHSSVVTSTEYLLGLRKDMPPDLAIFARMNHGAHGGGHEGHAMPAPSPEANMTPVSSPVPIRMTQALNRHTIVGEILATRTASISQAPAQEAVILVAHGPVPDDDNARWLADMKVLAAQVHTKAPYAAVDYLTVRDDAPAPLRDAAAAELRGLVQRHASAGRRVLVVPLLLSFGGIEQGIRKRLDGLDYTMATQGLMPDERLVDWVRAMVASSR